jgi:hypothetical protein
MGDSFIPRIAFENADDESTVFLALAHYVRHLVGHITIGHLGAVDELSRTASLMKEIHENAHTRQEFGPIPSDEEIAEELRNLGENN